MKFRKKKKKKKTNNLLNTLINNCFNTSKWSVGVAVGAGWQWLVAYINMGCYYLFGIPVGYIIAFPLNLGVQV